MALFSELFKSFVPILAFADNEEAALGAVESAEQSSPATEDVTPQSDEGVSPNSEEAVAEQDAKEDTVNAEEAAGEPAAASEPETPAESASEPETSSESTPEPEAGPEEDQDEDEDEDDEDEDEDDDEEGAGDPMDKLKEECAKLDSIKPFVHHYHECVERVTKEMEEENYADKEYKEDCVEEFFHLEHHINDCVAPRLFHKLK